MAEIKPTTARKTTPRKRTADRQDGGAATQPVAETKKQLAWEEVAQQVKIYELNNTDRRVVVVFAESDDAPALYRGVHSNARVKQGKPALLLDNGETREL